MRAGQGGSHHPLLLRLPDWVLDAEHAGESGLGPSSGQRVLEVQWGVAVNNDGRLVVGPDWEKRGKPRQEE